MADLRIGFLDVGHGDFIYATTPLGANLIIDVGRAGLAKQDSDISGKAAL